MLKTISAALAEATKQLRTAEIATARLDALVLLEDIVGMDRAQLLAYPDHEITTTQNEQLTSLIERRAIHEPLAYIRQKTEFYGRDFFVDHRVLEPRPESETIIDLLKKYRVFTPTTVIDVGTGSGALAITAKLELPEMNVLALDIDTKCLEVTSHNIGQYGVKINLYESDLLADLPVAVLDRAILLCNLPYVPDGSPINEAAKYEPSKAIFGGSDGLDVYRRLFLQIEHLLRKPSYILTESLPDSHQTLQMIAEQTGFVLSETHDFVQVFNWPTDTV